MRQRGRRRAGKVVVLALIGASIRLSFRGVEVCRWRCVGEDGRRWPAVIRSDTRISLIYCARKCVFFPRDRTSNLSLSLRFPIFSFSSPLSLLPLVYEVGNELWQLAARKNTATEKKIPHVRREKEVFIDRLKLGLGPTAIVLFRRSNDDPQDN